MNVSKQAGAKQAGSEQARYASNTVVAGELLTLAGRRALDIGCGDGKFTRFLARSGATTTGIDVNPAVIARARPKAAEEGLEITFLEARAEDLPFSDGSFDVVVFSNSLHHVAPDKMAGAFAEAARVLVPGGDLYVMEPVAEGVYFEVTKIVNDERAERNHARDAIAAAARGSFAQVTEVTFKAQRSWADFDAFVAARSEGSEKRRQIFAARREELRALFESAARHEDGRLAFDQIFRVNLLRRA